MKLFNRKKTPEKVHYWTFLSEEGERILEEKTFGLPLKDDIILIKSTEFFDDPDPCFIHRSAVMNRLYYEIDESAGKLPHGERLSVGGLPEPLLGYLKLPESVEFVLLS